MLAHEATNVLHHNITLLVNTMDGYMKMLESRFLEVIALTLIFDDCKFFL